MLFDLQGKRRRVVQGTYLALAILMGAGLVVFGIGGNVSGGLGDLLGGGGGSNKGNEIVEKRIETAEKQLQTNPKNEAALAQLIRGRYQLATANADPNTGQFDEDARPDLLKAAAAWEKYLATKPEKVNIGLARVMVQAYSGLAQGVKDDVATSQKYWSGAAGAVELIAAQQPNPNNYVALVQYASLAGQTSKAELAGKKAIELAPKKQRKAVEQEVESAKSAGGGGAVGGAGAPSGTVP